MTNATHDYTARVVWDGNTGEGTARYAGYQRAYRVLVAGKPELEGSADPAFRGDASKHNPEDLFLASISACHMLFYLALCALEGVRVIAYEDDAHGSMAMDADGGGRFVEVLLRPRVVVSADSDAGVAEALHAVAHARCFIANSCSVPIRNEASIVVA